jgi:hypothetical protein
MAVRFLLLAALVTSVGPGVTSGQDTKAPKGYKTPEAAFEAMKAAAKKADYKAFFAVWEPAGLDVLVNQLASAAIARREDKTGKFAEAFKDALPILDRHGLTPEATKPLPLPKSPDDIKAWSALVKDKLGFVGDLMPVIAKGKETAFKAAGDATMTDLAIKGDRATAKLTQPNKGKDEPVEFVKIGEGWFLRPSFKSAEKPKAPK